MTEDKNNQILSILIVEYRQMLFRIAYRILKNNADAEDAVSETTCKAFANFHKLKNVDKFKPWVIRILINESYVIAKKRKKYIPLDEEMVVENNETEIVDNLFLSDAFMSLNQDFRLVAILFYYENMSIKEISSILKIPVGTVNSRLNRSRQKLKDYFIKEGVYQYE